MIRNISFKVAVPGGRLDAAVLAFFPGSARPFVRRAIEHGNVFVNGRKASKGARLSAGDEILVKALEERIDNSVRPGTDCPLVPVYVSDALLAFDKPAGCPVNPLSRGERGTLANSVAAAYPECAAVGDGPLVAGALHRIDAETSGLVLFARSQEAFDAVRAQFSAQKVVKTYLALVEGCAAFGATLECDLAHDPNSKSCRMVDAAKLSSRGGPGRQPRPMRAVTRYEPVDRRSAHGRERTLLRVTIKTGVTHQIRAQLAMAGLPIVGDAVYGAGPERGVRGHCLHALAVSLDSPGGGRLEIATSPPPWAQ